MTDRRPSSAAGRAANDSALAMMASPRWPKALDRLQAQACPFFAPPLSSGSARRAECRQRPEHGGGSRDHRNNGDQRRRSRLHDARTDLWAPFFVCCYSCQLIDSVSEWTIVTRSRRVVRPPVRGRRLTPRLTASSAGLFCAPVRGPGAGGFGRLFHEAHQDSAVSHGDLIGLAV
jgi:hypothetical protein